MSAVRAVAVAAALGLVAAACGGDGDKASTTTAPPSTEDSTTTIPATTTTTAVDPELEKLLLVAADLPTFKEQAPSPDDTEVDLTCEAGATPALEALEAAPQAEGKTLVRGSADSPVEVSSFAGRVTPDQAEKAMTELAKPEVRACIEKAIRPGVEKDLPSGATVTFTATAAPAQLAGIDATVVVSTIGTVKAGATTRTFRFDLVFLRLDGTIVGISYSGLGTMATTAERQRIVAIAVRKLTATATSGTTTTKGTGSTSTTSRTGTTRRTTTTTRQGTTTSTTR